MPTVPVKVVDASALAALLFREPRCGEVAALLGDSPLAGPTLLRYEIGSVCLKKVRLYPEQRDALLAAHRLLDRMDLYEVEVPVHEALLLAESAKLTVYDASYMWLARSLQAELITLDSELKEASSRNFSA